MAFPGKKDDSSYSFGEAKGYVGKYEVSKPPRKYPFKDNTMAEYSNVEAGERYGERNVKGKMIKHHK